MSELAPCTQYSDCVEVSTTTVSTSTLTPPTTTTQIPQVDSNWALICGSTIGGLALLAVMGLMIYLIFRKYERFQMRYRTIQSPHQFENRFSILVQAQDAQDEEINTE